jgi:hypothetical protein
MKTGNDFTDEVLETRGGYADESTFDVVPGFKRLVVLMVGSRMGFGGMAGKASFY